MSTWTLVLPDMPYVTPNKRGHWSQRSRCNAAWRRVTYVAARNQRIPALERARVELHFWPGDRRRRDPDNLVSGVMKPCVDGLVDANVITDDTAAEVERVFPVIHPGPGQRRWQLVVTETAADAA